MLVNDRFGQKKEGVSDTRGVYGDFYHVEYRANVDRTKPWAMWRGFGNSYGYNQNEHPSNILSLKETVHMMVDVVADNGNVEFNASAITVVRLATASEPMRAAVLETTGVTITDTNGDGLPDSSEQVAAIYEYVRGNDVIAGDGAVVFRPDQTETFLYVGEGTQATTLAVSIATFTDDEIILGAKLVLEDAAAGIEDQATGVTALVSGGAITGQNSLDAFTRSMLTSLPVAIVLTSLLVFVVLYCVFRRFGKRAGVSEGSEPIALA